jgi:hypothetical protein
VIAFPVRHSAFFECRGESCSHHLAVDLAKLTIQVPSDNDLSLCVLPDDALH